MTDGKPIGKITDGKPIELECWEELIYPEWYECFLRIWGELDMTGSKGYEAAWGVNLTWDVEVG